MLCPHCNRWEIGANDVFCSWCRSKLVDFTVSLDRPYLYVGELLPKPLKLTVRHTGTVGAINVEQVSGDQQWLKPRRDKLNNTTIWQGNTLQIDVEVDTMTPSPTDYHKATLTVTSPAGERSVDLELVPPPDFDIIIGEYNVLLDLLVDEKYSGQVVATRGVVAVEEMWTDQEWARVKPLDPSHKLPYLLDERTNPRLDFEFDFDESKLMDASGGKFPAEHQGTLFVKFAGLDPPRERTFRANCYLPPSLWIPEALPGSIIQLNPFLGRREELQFTLQNGDESGVVGRADLLIHDVKIDAQWLLPISPLSFPLTIPSGQFNQIGFVATAREIGETGRIARITFLTNTPGAERQREVIVKLNVKQMPDFDGVVAIDFGTVNSCCATADRHDSQGQPLRIELEGKDLSQQPTTTPTAILYEDRHESGTRDYQIGSLPYQYSFDPIIAPSTVRQIKRRLGRTERLSISYRRDPAKQDNLLPREITADIIKRIIERAEDQLEGRIVTCAVSHPSRFSLRQIADLKAALAACGIREENVKTIHEPLGAAFSFMQESVKEGEDRNYHLMVYDFGGGTTDISLIHVKSRWMEEQGITLITPRVLGATGDSWFGGEDVTDFVMQFAFERCLEVLQAANPDSNVIIPFDADQFANNPRRKQSARENRLRLRGWAEGTKIAISVHGDEHEEHVSTFLPYLAVIVDNVETQKADFEYREVTQNLVAELNGWIKQRLDKLIEMMKQLSKHNEVDAPAVILLSGKSSALPVVAEAIGESFPESEIHMPGDLKECVVVGASRRFGTKLNVGVAFDIEDGSSLSATTSRLGIEVLDAGQSKFREVISAGVPIGNQGLRVRVRGVALERGKRISILENTGPDDELTIAGKDNRNIRKLKTFNLEHRLAEWERAHNVQIPKSDLFDSKIELEVTPNLAVKLIATIPGVDEPLEFEAVEVEGY